MQSDSEKEWELRSMRKVHALLGIAPTSSSSSASSPSFSSSSSPSSAHSASSSSSTPFSSYRLGPYFTLEDYENFSGVRFSKQELEEKATRGLFPTEDYFVPSESSLFPSALSSSSSSSSACSATPGNGFLSTLDILNFVKSLSLEEMNPAS
jgi:hypothetical protein